jgi:peroxiredoxin
MTTPGDSPFAASFVDSVNCAVQFCALGAARASLGEGSLLSWQRPNGPVWRQEAARRQTARVVARFGAALLALAGGLAGAAPPPYALIGQSAPDFALHAAVGGNARLSEHRGEVVVLSFWSSRCTPCRTQLESLNRSLTTYRSAGLAMFGIGVDDDPLQAREFARSNQVGFSLLLDPGKGVSRSYQVDNLPMTVLIDRSGTVRHVLRDYNAESEQLYLQQLRALLNE